MMSLAGSREDSLKDDELEETEVTVGSSFPSINSRVPNSSSLDIDTSSINIPSPRDTTNNEGDDASLLDITESQQSDALLSASGDTITDISNQFSGLGPETILRAVVFVEDAYMYRSINHKVDGNVLVIYRKFHSRPVILFRYTIIFFLHILAFVEYPSSLTITSDLRTRGERIALPCWLTQCLEFLCLIVLLLDNIMKMYLMGCFYFIRHKWDMTAIVIIIVSLVDWTVSFVMGCHEFVRFRRILRPYFILQNSSLMKKIVNCLRMTLPEVMSVLLLLALHLYIFTLFGMLLFPVYKAPSKNHTLDAFSNSSIPSTTPAAPPEGNQYFRSLLDSLISLLVLLTTANNPDVSMPAYSSNRLASIFFILYLLIGLYCFMNMLLAVIYNQFRGYFLSSMQSSLIRRRLGVRAAFEVLRRKKSSVVGGLYSSQGIISVGVPGGVIRDVTEMSFLPPHVKTALHESLMNREHVLYSATQFQELFGCMDKDIVHRQSPGVRWFASSRLRMIQKIFIHRYFTYFGMLMAFINLVLISIQLGSKYDLSFSENHSTLRIVNFTFAIFYLLEQLVKFWAFGVRRYLADKGNIYDAVITVALVIGEVVSAALYGVPYFPHSKEITVGSSSSTMWNILRIVNILIMARMFKIIPSVRSMSLVATVIIDLMKNMKSFAGILVVIFYAFAIVGMELFHGVIKYKPEFKNKTFACGTYEQLDYWANNFDDFFASIIVLWDVMVVNNWHVFLEVFRKKTSPWSYLYFVAWWLFSVVIVLNLFTALIMENFIMKWDRRNQITDSAMVTSSTYEDITVSVHLNNVHSMFRDLLQEPADNELLVSLSKHHYLKLDR